MKVSLLKVWLKILEVVSIVLSILSGEEAKDQSAKSDIKMINDEGIFFGPIKSFEIWLYKQSEKINQLIEKIESKIEYLEDDWYKE